MTGVRAPAFLRCTSGATAVEFAIILPLLLLFIVGGIELAVILFIGSSIELAVMEASRYGITGSEAGVSREEKVLEIVADRTYGLLDMDQVKVQTLVYQSFANIGEPEPFTDQNGNHSYQAGEPFNDVNGNGTWDAGHGQGRARRPGRHRRLPAELRLGRRHARHARDPRRNGHPGLQRRRPQRALLRRSQAMRALLTRLRRDRRGIAATEFALILPILVMFSAGTIEYSRLILLTQKLQSGTFILADLTARDKTLTVAQLDNIFLAIDNVVQPFAFDTDGKAIVSSIGVDAASNPIVNWQRAGSGALVATSLIGTAGGNAVLPADLSISSGETIISAEVYYAFKPLFGIGLSPRTIRRVAYYKPRLGTLDTLLP